MSIPGRVLVAALLALAALYAFWFATDPTPLAAWLVFAAPPALLAVAAWAGWRRAPFLAGVLALGWFSHGVMTAWAHPDRAELAWGTIALALTVVFASAWPGLRARFGRRD